MRVYVERAGSGPPLLSISGSGSSLAESLPNPLAEHFDVASYDHRGLGRSDAPDEPVTMADFASDALELADALGWETFAVLGVSFGGMVAQHLAVLAPSRVRRLALACTSAGGAGGSSYPLHERPSPEVMASLIDTRPEVAASLVALFASRTTEPREPGYTHQLEARRHHDVWDQLPLITAPTFVGSGRYDGIAPVANGEAIASRIPGAVHQVFDGGHAFLWQDPTAWPAFVDFLQA
jgi:3-oxoadipate enol-lactonase